MFKKLISSWKAEWFNRKESELVFEYSRRLESMIKQVRSEGEERLDAIRDQTLLEIETKESALKIIKSQNEDLSFQQKRLDDRKLELIQAQDELKIQIRLIEAKASPSSIFIEAFSQGINKAWDLLLPVMSENIDKLKIKMKEDAAIEAIQRLKYASNKK